MKKKYTVEVQSPTFTQHNEVSSEDEIRGIRIVQRTFDLLERIEWNQCVEVIKITLQTQGQFSAQTQGYAPHLMIDFQIPFTPFHYLTESSLAKDQRFVIEARWEGHHEELLKVTRRDGDQKVSLGQVELKDANADTLARALIEAMAIAMGRRQGTATRTVDWLSRETDRLKSLIEDPVAA